MGWLNKLTKTVEEGVNRATTEADKALRVGRVTTEIVGKRNEQDKQLQEIGRALWQLHKDGKQVPEELQSRFSRLEELERELVDLESQREAIKAGVGPQGQGSAQSTTVVEEEPAQQTFCTACGSALPAGASSCPQCGHKVVA
jgi:hypothetical protein